MPNRERLARQQRARQLAQAGKVERALLGAYREAWQTVRTELLAAVEQIRAAEAAGQSAEALRILRVQRLQALEARIEAEIQYRVNLHAIEITEAQADAVLAGRLNATQLLEASLPPEFQPAFPVEAFRNLVGFSMDGQPLGQLLGELGPAASQQVRRALVTGLARGLNPVDVARQARDALGGNMVRATTIARTEILRAYRTAALETYRANSDVVTGWVWLAELDSNTCEVCVAMNGELLDEEYFDSHPNCRCTAVPRTKTWEELGFPGVEETQPTIESGSSWFARQPETVQRAILGPGKLAAYQRGEITLQDLVQRTHSSRWGGGRTARSLSAALKIAA